jgi:hypothetical protein
VQIELNTPDIHIILEEINGDLVFELARSKEPRVVFLYPLSSECGALASELSTHLLEVLLELFLLHPSVLDDRFLLNLLQINALLHLPLFELLVGLFYACTTLSLELHGYCFQVIVVMLIKGYLRGLDRIVHVVLDYQEVTDNNIIFIRHYHYIIGRILRVSRFLDDLNYSDEEITFKIFDAVLPLLWAS